MPWVLLVLALLNGVAVARDPGEHFFQPGLGDLKGDLATARAEGKFGVLLMFEMDDCPFCQRMKATVLNQVKVQEYFRRHFLIYAMDVKGDTEMTDFSGKETTAKAFALAQRARATPTFVFYDLDGNAVARFTGATQTVDEFLLLGRYVVEGAYRTVPFTVYKRQPSGS